ncbi:unnamed protein product [Symbiodinium natans]|uniref:Uncharacterized protein n=1 Tax=Symbiodinium natans TaxID=878477 RepID=A0A812QZ19_9DINO|nr:unnamed protein product [Symbiodinium natans]
MPSSRRHRRCILGTLVVVVAVSGFCNDTRGYAMNSGQHEATEMAMSIPHPDDVTALVEKVERRARSLWHGQHCQHAKWSDPLALAGFAAFITISTAVAAIFNEARGCRANASWGRPRRAMRPMRRATSGELAVTLAALNPDLPGL